MQYFDKSIHIINGHGIGDVIMMLPLIRSLLKHSPHTVSFTLKSKTEAEVLELFFPDHELSFIFLEEIYKSFRPLALIKYALQLRRLKLDVVLTAFATNPMQASIVSFLSGAQVRIGWKNILDWLNTNTLSPIPGQHKVHKHLRLISDKLITTKFISRNSFVPDRNHSETILNILIQNGFDPKINTLIALTPGSGELEAHKRWPASNYKALTEMFINFPQVRFIILGSFRELSISEKILTNNKNAQNILNFVGSYSITDTAYLLYHCHVTVGNCNGLAHLASAVGIPVLGLYGPTNYHLTGPFSQDFKALSLHLNCSPCYRKDFMQGCGDPICLSELPVRLVYEALLHTIEHLPTPL